MAKLDRLVRQSLPLLAALSAALIGWAAAATPGLLHGRNWIGLAAVWTMLSTYAVAAIVFPPRAGAALPFAGPIGLAAGAVYAAEIALEYALTPADNTPFGLAEFGTVFALFAIAGGLAARASRRFSVGLTAAIWTAMISALIWYAVLIAVFLIFRGSERQALVLAAEGDLEDFRRSGVASFDQFVVQDFFGAGFYHLLLAPLIAAVLGSLGAGLGLLAARLPKRSPP